MQAENFCGEHKAGRRSDSSDRSGQLSGTGRCARCAVEEKKEAYDEAVEQISEYQTKIDNNDYYVECAIDEKKAAVDAATTALAQAQDTLTQAQQSADAAQSTLEQAQKEFDSAVRNLTIKMWKKPTLKLRN